MNAAVARHRTALHRADLSRPVKAALESGLLAPGRTFFDYGCGRGGDMERLRALGYAADGWDPHHRPDAPQTAADVVNLGYILNVIWDLHGHPDGPAMARVSAPLRRAGFDESNVGHGLAPAALVVAGFRC